MQYVWYKYFFSVCFLCYVTGNVSHVMCQRQCVMQCVADCNSVNQRSISTSTGQWSDPNISVCIFAPLSLPASLSEARK